MRLDTYLDVDQAVARYLELIKVAALIERAREGQSLETALPEVNEILAQCATPEQREILEQSGLDSWLRDTERDPAERPSAAQIADVSGVQHVETTVCQDNRRTFGFSFRSASN